jgi:hypothetical protein
MNLFKGSKQIDERILWVKNQIYKEVYAVAAVVCILSIIIKLYIKEYGINEILTELSVLIISSVYIAVRMIMTGVYSDETEVHDRANKIPLNRKQLIFGVILGIVIALYFGIRSSLLYAESISQRVWYFSIVSFASLSIYCPIFILIMTIPTYIAGNCGRRDDTDDESKI